MKTEINDGGKAFPAVSKADYPNEQFGMSLRDWFAGMALQGMLAANYHSGDSEMGSVIASRHAYLFADEMIARRENNEEDQSKTP